MITKHTYWTVEALKTSSGNLYDKAPRGMELLINYLLNTYGVAVPDSNPPTFQIDIREKLIERFERVKQPSCEVSKKCKARIDTTVEIDDQIIKAVNVEISCPSKSFDDRKSALADEANRLAACESCHDHMRGRLISWLGTLPDKLAEAETRINQATTAIVDLMSRPTDEVNALIASGAYNETLNDAKKGDREAVFILDPTELL